ncbi:MAG TPA: PPOX class F420-dependent oxidoreductase [Acidimicrobiales bacterium]|nr:PPOX class F420-dependent oxidoreductase [Acidimicrobiales bacterium]
MLDDNLRTLAQGKNFAAFTTLLPSGQPMTHVMWVDADDEHIYINTEIGRQKFRNVQKDPRVTVTVIDAQNPYRYAELRGTVVSTVRGEEARQHIDVLSEKYTGGPYNPDAIGTERVILKIAPERQRSQG